MDSNTVVAIICVAIFLAFFWWLGLIIPFVIHSLFNPKFWAMRNAYAGARQKTLHNKQLSFGSLPVFPVRAPYDSDQEQKSKQLQATSSWSLDALMDYYLVNLRQLMPELMFMRGDKHEAWSSHSRVLLAIEEVEQSRRELAVVALVVQKRGSVVSISIRRSGWPRTIHTRASIFNNGTRKVKGFRSGSYYETCARYFFPPAAWEVSNVSSRGDFSFSLCASFCEETTEAAEAIGTGILGWILNDINRRNGTYQ